MTDGTSNAPHDGLRPATAGVASATTGQHRPARPLVLGHRGSRVRGGPTENTLAALFGAVAAGADGVETDVRRLADGTLVLHHDPRLPDGRALVGLGPSEVAAAGVVTVADLLDAWPADRRLVLEVKNGPGEPDFDAGVAPDACATARLLAELLAVRSALPSDLVVSSFDWHTLDRLRELGAPGRRAFLTPPGTALRAGAAWCAENGAQELHAAVVQVLSEGDDGVDACRSRGVDLVAWTVTAPDRALLLRGLGVDAVICDDPASVVTAYEV